MTNASPQTEIFGLVLNGGRSSRMGFDKGLLDFHGSAQRDYLYEAMKSFCRQVFISAKAIPPGEKGDRFITDRFDFETPLNGILSALQHNSDVAWLTAPVDMPGIDAAALEHLIAQRDPYCLATCYLDSDGQSPEPLVAIWEAKALDPLMKFFLNGNKSPRAFLKQSRVKLLKAPSPAFHANVNTPSDYANYQKPL